MKFETVAKMRRAHKVLAEFEFEPAALDRGYANRTLRIDVGGNAIRIDPVSQQMKDLWVGGKGFDLWLMFHEINPATRWDSPENPICMSAGPLGGTSSFPGSGKTLVTTVSPLTNIVIDSNVGGFFGPYLKFAGFDALTLVGKAQAQVIVYIDAVHGKITLEEAPLESVNSHLAVEEFTEMYADDEFDKRNISVVSAGQGAYHARMGLLNFSFWDWRRGVARIKQAGRGGVGTVFVNKNIKALVIKNRQYTPAWRIAESKVAKLYPLPTDEKPCATCDRGLRKDVVDIIDKWHRDPDYVIEMMQDVQERDRYISRSAVDTISLTLGVPRGQLYHIATFYKAFSLTPRGESVIQVCVGTACHVKGAGRIVDAFERELGIRRGETTRDGKYTLEAVACLGCCSVAPVAKLGDYVYGDLQTKDIPKVLKDYGKSCVRIEKAMAEASTVSLEG